MMEREKYTNQTKKINGKVIGIVGGMGPHSGNALLNDILNVSSAAKMDQEHLSTILVSFPGEVVDRTKYINGEITENPAYSIAGLIQKLKNAGADVVGIACNTAHSPVIFDVINQELKEKGIDISLLNMVDEVAFYISDLPKPMKRIGLLTTNGTYQSKVYQGQLIKQDLEVVIPDFELQSSVIHKMIYDEEYGIKSSPGLIRDEVIELLKKAIAFFSSKQVDALVLGCTELSLLKNNPLLQGMCIIDSTEVLAKALVREATIQ